MNPALTIIGLIFLVAIGYVGLVTYTLVLELDDANYCEFDADCVLVRDASDLCSVASVHKDYKIAWDKKLKYISWLKKKAGLTEECIDGREFSEYEPLCSQNRCIARQSLFIE